jgi:hypothetical protein
MVLVAAWGALFASRLLLPKAAGLREAVALRSAVLHRRSGLDRLKCLAGELCDRGKGRSGQPEEARLPWRWPVCESHALGPVVAETSGLALFATPAVGR